MPRLFHRGQWYDPVSSRSLYEADYEAAILAHAETLFPGFVCVPFKTDVRSEFGVGKPDLALIERNYRSWLVVEVELDTHPLKAHVEDQVRKFSLGRYDDEHAQYVESRNPSLDGGLLRQMLLGEPPRVLVLVTRLRPDWSTTLAQYNAQIGVIEMFRNDLGDVIFRVNGEQPTAPTLEELSVCVRDYMLPKAWRLLSPASFSGLETLELTVEGESTLWKIIRVRDAAWITPAARSPVEAEAGERRTILKSSQGDLIFMSMGSRT